jgi:hypothetical protein
MTKAKSKHKPASRTNDSKIKRRNSVMRTTAPAEHLKHGIKPAAHQQRQSASRPTAGRESKKAQSSQCWKRQVV